MPRQKLSEYRAKVLVSEGLGLSYIGWSISEGKQLAKVRGFKSYVLKVDQAEKKRFKNGLVLLDIAKKDLASNLKKLQKKGYEYFIVEPYQKHDQVEEKYISLSYDKHHHIISYSSSGGVDVEDNADRVYSVVLDEKTDWLALARDTGFREEQLQKLLDIFKQQHFTFLEINPYTIINSNVQILDAAVEVDDAGSYFVDGWTSEDLRSPKANKRTASEEVVAELDENSPASFNLSVLNPHGSIFLILSGGGASVVVADEIYNHGLGGEIANYGEYSGNPTEDETYIYTSALLKLLLASKAKKKVLFIGGAVANFTDIANTFAGVVRALDDYAQKLQAQKVRIYVRRGGPRQEIGLAQMRDVLEKYGLLGDVYDPTTSIHSAVKSAIQEVR